MFGRLPQHLRYAVRLLLRAPLFTLTAVLSLAVGIGANTSIFTAANALLLAPTAGLAGADRLVDIGASRDGAGLDTLSFPTYTEVRDRSRLLDGVYAVGIEPRPVSLGRDGGAESIFAQFVSASFFDVLGVTPDRGTFFRTAEEQVGVPLRKVVLNDLFWRRQFGADPSIVGRSIVLNGDSFLVVGVAPKGFHGTTILAPDIWVPLTAYGKAMPSDSLTRSRQSLWLVMGARLKPGVTIPQARAELASIGQALAKEFPDPAGLSRADAGTALVVEPTSRVPGEAGQAIIPIIVVLGSVVGLVLVIACVNLAGLLLVRAASRSREIALRVALGASRGDLATQLLAESLLLFALGGGAGLLLARWMSATLLAYLPALPVPLDLGMAMDWRVIAFAAGLSLATGVLTGMTPALWSGRTDLVTGLKTDEAAPKRQRLRHTFLGAQMGLCLLLIVVAGLFLRALGAAVRADPGIRVEGIDVAAVDLSLGGYTDARAVAATEDIRSRLAALPGVTTVAAGAVVPLAGDGLGLGSLHRPGTSGPSSNIDADWNVVTPEFLPALGIPLVAGRNFGARDRVGQPLVAIVNERFARTVWPGEDPVGKTLENADGGPGAGANSLMLTVVGVARNGKYRWIGDRPRNFIYVPVAQQTWQRVHFFVVREPGLAASRSLMPDARAALKAFDPNLPLIQMTRLQDFADLGLLPQRLAASVAGSLGTVALLLAMIGIYGVTACAVTRRTREIGVRMALGADRSTVMWLVIGQVLRLSAIGGALGLAAAAAVAQLISGLLFGISPLDPVIFGGTVVALTLVTAAASYMPARRAARVDPMVALRAE